jgi:microcystin-dependent protein
MDEYIGIVKLFAGTFAPKGWAFCDGRLMSISQNSALFAILGTIYGGDGQTTFALPDLRSRVAVGAGVGPGLSPYQPGQRAGNEQISLSQQQMPAHTHLQQFSSDLATTSVPGGNVLATSNGLDSQESAVTVNAYAAVGEKMVAGSPNAIGFAGGSQPVNIMQPYLGMNYIICTNGLFPSRD